MREKSHCLSVINLHARALALAASLSRPPSLPPCRAVPGNQPSVVNRRVNAITHKTKTKTRESIQSVLGRRRRRRRNVKSAVIWLIIASHRGCQTKLIMRRVSDGGTLNNSKHRFVK